MFKGKRENNVDYFDDVLQGGTGGVFEGGALNGFESVKERVEADGVHVQLDCRYCGKATGVVLDWEELFVVGSNQPGLPPLLPRGWAYSPNNQDAYIAMNCPKCGNQAGPGLNIHYRPDEARQLVNAAVQRGFINPAQIQQWKQQVAQARGM